MTDPCARKHGGNPESSEAYSATAEELRAIMRQRIYRLACRRSSSGVTTDEISTLFGKPPNAVSGRLTELKREGRIVATDSRRKTRTGRYARVYVAVQG